MMAILVLVLLAVNLGISYVNAMSLGRAWVELTHAGVLRKLLAYILALMPACGFTWCYLIIATFTLVVGGKLSLAQAETALNLGYILIIPGLLLSGLVITIQSWARAWRQRSFANLGIAGYNTFAQAYNTYNAVQGVGPAFGNVFGTLFKGKGKKDGNTLIVVLVVLALLGGVITTAAIISHYAAQTPLPEYKRRKLVSQRDSRQSVC